MANNGFIRKKVESLTLGEKLRKIRSEYRISLNEVAKNTKIQIKYLEYIENGEYEKLPADVYVRGFVRSYAHFLNADENILIKLYERERNIQQNLKKDQFQKPQVSTFQFHRITITPKMFIISFILMLVSAGFWYLYREFQSFASIPQLIVYEPSNGQVIQGSEFIVRGKTEKDAKLLINEQPTLVTENGDFYEKLRLQPGLNTLTITAINSFKKEKTETISVQADYEVLQAKPDESTLSISGTELEENKKKYEISILNGDPVQVMVILDGNVVYNGDIALGSVKSFEALKEIKISSSDGKRTLVRKDSGDFVPLSASPGEVKDVTFSNSDLNNASNK